MNAPMKLRDPGVIGRIQTGKPPADCQEQFDDLQILLYSIHGSGHCHARLLMLLMRPRYRVHEASGAPIHRDNLSLLSELLIERQHIDQLHSFQCSRF